MPKPPLYQIISLKHRYGKSIVLDIDSLEIAPGVILGLAGPNGSGKSTLLRLLGFIDKPTAGTILFQGEPALPFDARVRFRVTLLSQAPYLMKRTVYRNIVYGLKLRHHSRDHKKRIYEALEQVGLDAGDFARRNWNELSGGEAQRVALAARLALKPEVLLLDEPTASVDVHSSQLIRSTITNVRRRQGTTLIVASHDREWLDAICDRVISLFKGRITGKDRDNIVFGPWRALSDGTCQKVLADGQVLTLPNPPAVEAVASLDPDALEILPRNAASAFTSISSTSPITADITRLATAKGEGRMIVSLRVGELNIAACIDAQLIETQKFYPGKEVLLEIPPAAVSWIPLSTGESD